MVKGTIQFYYSMRGNLQHARNATFSMRGNLQHARNATFYLAYAATQGMKTKTTFKNVSFKIFLYFIRDGKSTTKFN